MKKLLLLLLIANTVNSQTFQWIQPSTITISTNPEMVAFPNTVDASGNVYMAGFQDFAFPYGSDTFGNLMFNKYSPDGTLLFSKTFTGKGSIGSIVSDSQGNIIIAASYVTTLTIGTTVVTDPVQEVKPLVVKFDSQGNLLWYWEPGTVGQNIGYARGLAVDASDNIYVGYDSFMNCYISKLAPDGTVGQTIVQTQVSLLSSVSVDNEGNIYAAGSCAETNANYNGTTVLPPFSYSTWLVKYNASGVYQWVKYVEDITCSKPKVKAVTPDQVYFASHLYGAFAFGDITAEGPISGMFNDFYLAKLNASGTYQWVREVPGTGAVVLGYREYLAADAGGNAYVAGTINGPANFGNGITCTSQPIGTDGFVIKYSPDGLPLMAYNIGGIAQDRIDGVTADANGVYISGLVRGSATFGALSIIIDSNIPYVYTAKISNAVLGVNNPEYTIGVYPNPVSDFLYLNTPSGNIKGGIYNTLGQKVTSFEVSTGEPVNVSALANGVYLIKAEDTGAVKRFIVKR